MRIDSKIKMLLPCVVTHPQSQSQRSSILRVRVQTKASRSRVVGFQESGPQATGSKEGVLHLRVTAPPEGGKANAAVVALVAKSLRVPRSSVSIVKGFASRDKVLRVNFLTLDEIKERLDPSQ